MQRILLSFVLFVGITSFSQKNTVFQNFDTTGMETTILVQKSPLFNLETNKISDVYSFYQTFKTISQSDFKHRLVNVSHLKKVTKNSYFTQIIPLALLHTSYETIQSTAFKNGSVSVENTSFVRHNASNIFEKHTITVASTLRKTYKGLKTQFELSTERIFNTTKDNIADLKIDFDNGEGFQTVKPNTVISVQYHMAGPKTLQYQIRFDNGQEINLQSSISIVYSNDDLERLFARSVSTFTSSITPDLSIYGEVTSYAGQGEYEVFLSDDSILDKPIFIVDGFDPSDSRPILGYTDSSGNYKEGIYDFFNFTDASENTNNLLELLKAEGFDIVILNFPVYTRTEDNTVIDGGVDFIERNAMLLVDVINQINNDKTGDAQNVVIGPSMGGLITQYALNYMENTSLNHDTRLWLAFDSPLLGANVPIGFQHQFNFLANGLNDFWFIGDQNVEALQPVVNGMMKSSAARQMLVDQLEAHITNSDGVTFNSSLQLPQKHTFNPLFFNRMHGLTSSGFPENLRKIAIINGSGSNMPYQDKEGNDILPGREIVDADIDVTTGTEAFLNVRFTPYADTTTKVSDVYIDFAIYIPAFDVESEAFSESFPFSDGVDAAPGGLFDLAEVTSEVGTTGLAGEFVTALQTDYFNFIPAVSSMALSLDNDEIDWFHAPNNANISNETPFDAWYMPVNNEDHITLTQENVDFTWNEIVISTATVNTLLNNAFTLVNPVSNELIINSKILDVDFELAIFDVTGKRVFNKTIQVTSSQIKLPIALSKGVYFTKIKWFDNVMTKKLIVE